MSLCICQRCFYGISLRAGGFITSSTLLVIKTYETFMSSIDAIDIANKAAKDTSHNYNSERTAATAVAIFHWTTMLIVCTLWEGYRKQEPRRVIGFIVASVIAYLIYIPVFIYNMAVHSSDYTQHDWGIAGFRMGIIALYVWVILIARSYHHELTNKNRSNPNRNTQV